MGLTAAQLKAEIMHTNFNFFAFQRAFVVRNSLQTIAQTKAALSGAHTAVYSTCLRPTLLKSHKSEAGKLGPWLLSYLGVHAAKQGTAHLPKLRVALLEASVDLILAPAGRWPGPGRTQLRDALQECRSLQYGLNVESRRGREEGHGAPAD